jgi:hypothetical protein
MPYLYPIPAVESARRQNESALPGAPVVPDEPPRRGLLRRLGGLIARSWRDYRAGTPSRRTASRRGPSTTTRTSPEV